MLVWIIPICGVVFMLLYIYRKYSATCLCCIKEEEQNSDVEWVVSQSIAQKTNY
jgi:hypothetical protein